MISDKTKTASIESSAPKRQGKERTEASNLKSKNERLKVQDNPHK